MILQTWVCATAALLVLMWFISLSILFFATEDLLVFYTCILCSWLNWKPLKTNILKMEALVEEEDFSVFGFSTILGWIPVFWDTYGLCGRQQSSFTSSKRQYLINLNMYVCVYICTHQSSVPSCRLCSWRQFSKLLSWKTFFTLSAISRQDISLTF